MKPIRCYTCGKVLGNKWSVIDALREKGESLKAIYEIIGLRRYCCKRIVLTSVDDSIDVNFTMEENITVHKENPKPNFIKIT